MHGHRSPTPLARRAAAVCAAALLALTLCAAPRARAQDAAESQQQRRRAMELYDQNKFTEALPLLEQLVQAAPKDIVLWERLGWATYVTAHSIKDPEARRKARARARRGLPARTGAGRRQRAPARRPGRDFGAGPERDRFLQ